MSELSSAVLHSLTKHCQTQAPMTLLLDVTITN